jgi:uncharacterized protein YndB with AHSA1/START domain
MTKTIEHEVVIDARPAKVFAALMDSKQHTAFTGEPAKIRAKVGGTFNCYGEYIRGVTLALERPKLIVQAWRSRNWPVETWSIVTFKLSAKPAGRTLLRFTQIGVPAADYAAKNKGWRTHYWEPLKKFLESR